MTTNENHRHGHSHSTATAGATAPTTSTAAAAATGVATAERFFFVLHTFDVDQTPKQRNGNRPSWHTLETQ